MKSSKWILPKRYNYKNSHAAYFKSHILKLFLLQGTLIQFKIFVYHSDNCLFVFEKDVKKLAGAASGTASWCTNVGNEHGQVLMSVLTDEGDGLDDMAEGLMQRYISANIPPPKVLYADRDCCSTRSKQQFHRFPEILVRLDIWHFMRRLAMACCSESHALYGTFMLHLSGTIFEWDP